MQQSLVLGLCDIVVLILLTYLILHSAILLRRRRRIFLWAILLTICTILAEGCTIVAEGAHFPGARELHTIANAVGFSVSVVLPLLLALLMDEAANRWPIRLLFLPVALVCALALCSPWTGWIFCVTADNQYMRGPAFIAFILAYLYGFCLLVLASFLQAHRFERSEGIYLSLLVLMVLCGTTVQLLAPQLHTSWHCITAGLVLYYVFLRELSAKYDVVTGSLCRAAFEQHFDLLPPQGSAVLIFDLDDFKQVNDRYGHEVGDQCLAAAGRLLQRAFRPMGRCYRVGGDEFAVLANEYSELMLESCVHSMMELLLAERAVLPMLPYISYGCGCCDGSAAIARHEADSEMYRYKYRVKSTL